MTKRAVWQTYQEFLDEMTEEMLDIVAEEFGGGLLGKTARTGAKRVTSKIQTEMHEQGRLVVEYAALVANDEKDQAYEDRFLRSNPVYQRYEGSRKAELREELVSHFHRVSADLAPLVASPKDDFWDALRAEYTRSEAEEIVERHFNQSKTFQEYRDGIFTSERLGTKVLYVIEEGETRLRNSVYAELDCLYAEGDNT